MSTGDERQDRDHPRLFQERTPKSRDFHERAAKTTPLGVESKVRGFDPYPFYADGADGSYVYDIDDNEYLDFLIALGHEIRTHRDTWHSNEVQFADWWSAGRGVLFANRYQGERFFSADSTTGEEIDHALEVAEEAFRGVDHEYE